MDLSQVSSSTRSLGKRQKEGGREGRKSISFSQLLKVLTKCWQKRVSWLLMFKGLNHRSDLRTVATIFAFFHQNTHQLLVLQVGRLQCKSLRSPKNYNLWHRAELWPQKVCPTTTSECVLILQM